LDDPALVVAKALNAASTARESGQAEDAVAPTEPGAHGLMDARSLVAEMGWCVPSAAAATRQLGRILDTLTELGVDIDWQALLPYAQLADRISGLDCRRLRTTAPRSHRQHLTITNST
jgi:hypothetical protein